MTDPQRGRDGARTQRCGAHVHPMHDVLSSGDLP